VRARGWVAAALVFATVSARADDRGGFFDLVAEGGALAGTRGEGLTPIAQIDVLGRARVARHLALTGGITTLPVPEIFAIGALGRIEWLPFDFDGDPMTFGAFAGSRLLVVQSLECVAFAASTCSTTGLLASGGILGELGVELRTPRDAGYRFSFALSAVAGVVAPYGEADESLRAVYVGGIAGLGVTF